MTKAVFEKAEKKKERQNRVSCCKARKADIEQLRELVVELIQTVDELEDEVRRLKA